jgi:hypothetical protein
VAHAPSGAGIDSTSAPDGQSRPAGAIGQGAFATDYRKVGAFDCTRKKPPGGAELPQF